MEVGELTIYHICRYMFQEKECLYNIEYAMDHITIAEHMFFGSKRT